MKATSVTWRRTFPDSAPGTDGVAIFEGRVIGRVRHLTDLPRDLKPWSWSVTDPDLAGQPGWSDTHGETGSRRQAMARVMSAGRSCAPPLTGGGQDSPQTHEVTRRRRSTLKAWGTLTTALCEAVRAHRTV